MGCTSVRLAAGAVASLATVLLIASCGTPAGVDADACGDNIPRSALRGTVAPAAPSRSPVGVVVYQDFQAAGVYSLDFDR